MKVLSPLAEEFFLKGKADGCPVYDLHGHMGPFYGLRINVQDVDAMVSRMDKAGVAMLVFCHHAALLSPDIGNQVHAEAVRRYPDRLRAYLAVNPRYSDTVRRHLANYDNYADVYVGLKFLADYHQVELSGESYRSAWEFADERGLLVLLHTWGGSPYDGPGQVRAMAERYRQVKILMGHCCHGDWDHAVRLANDFPNVYLELCAVPDERGVLEHFVRKCGSEKVVFGTDFPWFNHHYYIGAVLGADMSDDDRHNIFHRNAERLLGLA